jgi:hypothetical protein
MRIRTLLVPIVAGGLLGGCVVMPTAPTVMSLPGAQKSLDQFNADDGACRDYAQARLAGPTPGQQAAANSAATGALLGAATGALIGAATGQAGQGAAIGAGTGLLWGSAAGSGAAYAGSYEAQRIYDVAYAQCMYAKGNQIPGRRTIYTGAASGYPPPNTPPPRLAPAPGSSYPPPNTPPPPGVAPPG